MRAGPAIGIDLADEKQALAVIDHDVRVLASKTVWVKAFRLGEALDWSGPVRTAPVPGTGNGPLYTAGAISYHRRRPDPTRPDPTRPDPDPTRPDPSVFGYHEVFRRLRGCCARSSGRRRFCSPSRVDQAPVPGELDASAPL